MKAVPILIITNVVSLVLILLLFLQQEDLKGQLGSSRASTERRSDAPAQMAGLDDRLARLEARLGARAFEGDLVGDELLDPDAGIAPEQDLPLPSPARSGEEGRIPLLGDDEAALAGMSTEEMDTFRRRVRRAQELNAEEERIRRVVDRIDSLTAENRIAPLSTAQKEQVARTILATRQAIPDIWRRVRETNDLRSMSRDDRAQVMRAEFEGLRIEAQKALEEHVPAADAKVIVDDAFQDRGGMFGGRGPVPFGGRSGGSDGGGGGRRGR